jgi:hypothetical protein
MVGKQRERRPVGRLVRILPVVKRGAKRLKKETRFGDGKTFPPDWCANRTALRFDARKPLVSTSERQRRPDTLREIHTVSGPIVEAAE